MNPKTILVKNRGCCACNNTGKIKLHLTSKSESCTLCLYYTDTIGMEVSESVIHSAIKTKRLSVLFKKGEQNNG